jgi:competence protein ComEC
MGSHFFAVDHARILAQERGSKREGFRRALHSGTRPRCEAAYFASFFIQFTATTIGGLGLSSATPPAPPAGEPTFTIDVVDVGTGLAVLVRGADFTLVYDGGSNDDLARGQGNRMLAYMKDVAPTFTTIDHLILSHPHRDHVELLPDLFGAYQVRQVWDSGRVNDICGYRAFMTAVRDEPGLQYHNALQDFGTRSYAFTAGTCYGNALPAETLILTQASRITDSPVTLGQSASMKILHADGASHSSFNENTLVVRLDLAARECC